MLDIKGLSVGYKDVLAVQDVSLTVRRGEVVSLIGSNGAGKSTILRTIAGLLRPRRARSCSTTSPSTSFPLMTSSRGESLWSRKGGSCSAGCRSGTTSCWAPTPWIPTRMSRSPWRTFCSCFPGSESGRKQRAETLSGGEQQQVAIARGLMSRPSLLMLDEPSLGIMPKLVAEIFETIHDIRQKGITVFLVEQNVYEALSISDRAYVLQTGRIVLEGKGKSCSSPTW